MLLEFTNCRVLREGRFTSTSLWVEGGKVVFSKELEGGTLVSMEGGAGLGEG